MSDILLSVDESGFTCESIDVSDYDKVHIDIADDGTARVDAWEAHGSHSGNECPNCGGETEFVQFGGADSPVVDADPEDIDGGELLELRSCLDCGAQVEQVLTVDRSRVKTFDEADK